MSDISVTSRCKLLRPCDRFIEEKKQHPKSKCEEANANRKELEQTFAKIDDAAFALGITAQCCSIKKCHERIHTVCTCRMAKCESVFFCGKLSRVLIFKPLNTKCLHALLSEFASLQMFVEWRRNFPKWAVNFEV